MPRRARFFASVVILSVVALSACGGEDESAATIEPGMVILRPATFQPETIRIEVGQTVTWQWQEKVSHNIVGKGGIDKQVADTGTYELTFEKKGTYDYSCTIHPGMTGSVVVE